MRVTIAALLASLAPLCAPAADEATGGSRWHAAGAPVARQMAKSAGDSLARPAPVDRAPLMTLRPGRACGASEFEVCLDSTGRVSVPGAKRFLPEFPGLKPERLTVKRTGIVFGYSF